VLVLVGH